MADTEDQTITGSNCMKYRRQSGGVLLKNNCDVEMIFAVQKKSSLSGGGKSVTNNIPVSAKDEKFYPTGGSDNVVSVGIGSKD